MAKRTAILQASFTAEGKKLAKQAAEAQGRSLSSFLEHLVVTHAPPILAQRRQLDKILAPATQASATG
jgi:uncharacterized protein (DUF1778 family)